MVDRRAPWSHEEVEATVSSYFRMLVLQLSGQNYNKTKHRTALRRFLNDRSESAIEQKHQNISAILIELRYPYIPGYKPLGNYQSLLRDVVADRVCHDTFFNDVVLAAVERPAVVPPDVPPGDIFEPPPELRLRIASDRKAYQASRAPVTRDYLALEARNQALGRAGEEYVAKVERARLVRAGKESLAGKIEHVSATQGDGLGYDILSFETTGRPRLIEVKTTSFGKETPFYLSRGELEFSKAKADEFQLYRLFSFRQDPRIFALKGSIEGKCLLDPITYLARFS